MHLVCLQLDLISKKDKTKGSINVFEISDASFSFL